MKIRSKKQNKDGIVRMETSGEVKEVIFNEDFLNPKEAKVAVCYKGKESSGIVEFSPDEIEDLFNQIMPKMNLVKGVRVMKFEK